MDTQIIGEGIRDDEWAVDRIKSHAGDKGNVVFEVLWKSGDNMASILPNHALAGTNRLHGLIQSI